MAHSYISHTRYRATCLNHACLVVLIIRIGYEGRDITMPTGPDGMGPVAKAMYDTIVGIQTGEIEHEWSVIANDAKL